MRRTFGKIISELADEDDKIYVLVGDIGYRVFDEFREKHPDRFINMGICEQSIIGVSAGMALEGLKPWVYTITPFLIERPFEQVKLDIDQQNVNVKFNNGDTLQVKSSQYYHLLCVLGALTYSTSFSIDSKNMMNKLKAEGIATRPFFWPMHKQKILKKYTISKNTPFTNSNYICKYGLYLPSSLKLKTSEINFNCLKINKILKKS